MSLFPDTTYPSETTLTTEQALIVSEIRKLIGDTPSVRYDAYGFVSDDKEEYSTRTFRSGTLYKFEDRAWPLKVSVSGTDYTTLADPTVNNYEWLLFSTSALNEETFEMFYMTFRFSDREILEAYDQALVLLSERSIPVEKIPSNLCVMQAAILLLDGEFQTKQGFIMARDGRTEMAQSGTKGPDFEHLNNLKRQLKEMMDNVRTHIALNLPGIRLE